MSTTNKEKKITPPLKDQVSKMYQSIGKHLVSRERPFVGNPGGILFTSRGFKETTDITLDELTPQHQVNLGDIKMTGEEFQQIIDWYDQLQENGYDSSCMDPRPVGTENLEGFCTHKACGAANLVATQLTITAPDGSIIQPSADVTSGTVIETKLHEGLNVDYLDLVPGTEGGHQDTGIIVSFDPYKVLNDRYRQEMIDTGVGGPYLNTFDSAQIKKLFDENDLSEDEREKFLHKLVEVNVGIALRIATGHNSLDAKETGFHIIIVGYNESDKIQNQIYRITEDLVSKYMPKNSGIAVTWHTAE